VSSWPSNRAEALVAGAETRGCRASASCRGFRSRDKKNGGDPVARIAPVEAHLPVVGGLRPAQRLRTHRLRCRACNRDGGIIDLDVGSVLGPRSSRCLTRDRW
jgi:hypothetical protein